MTPQPDSSPFSPPTAAYIHIPFCRRRCFYCDFPISVVGDRPSLPPSTSPDTPDSPNTFPTITQYIEILCQEITLTSAQLTPIDTLFFGGGTPSLLTPAQLHPILQTLTQHFSLTPTAEISIEIDPGTFDLDRLQSYRAAGINRVSLGIQSFYADILQACGRTHTPADIHHAIELIHQVGLTNFSLDLISGLPHLTLDRWQATLDQAIALNPPHLSIYDLTLEPGTSFHRWYQPGSAPLPSDDTTAQMYRLAHHTLTAAGYDHYEISNYAKPGHQCRHNRTYWENRPYYGFGMAAASYTHGQRYTRPRKRREYYDWVAHLQTTDTLDCPIASPEEQLLDTLMLGLRLTEGIALNRIQQQFGHHALQNILTILQPHIQSGWVEITTDAFKLTNPEGYLFSNIILSDLFSKL